MKETGAEAGIEDVIARRTPELMRIPGVTGVGQALCAGAPCIRVYISSDSARARIPQELDGYAVSVIVTGIIRPQSID